MLDRHDLTRRGAARLEPLLSDRSPRRGGRWLDHRMVINGAMWRTRSGSPWRDLPPEYGKWKSVYNRHRRWSGDGTWEGILEELRRASSDSCSPIGVPLASAVTFRSVVGMPMRAQRDCWAQRGATDAQLGIRGGWRQQFVDRPHPHSTPGHHQDRSRVVDGPQHAASMPVRG